MELPKKLGIAGGIMFFMAITFGWIAFPMLLKSQINAAKALKQGSEMRDLWIELPFSIPFKIYLFNITNPVEIENGEKPIVHEIGPYFYDEYKTKVNLVDREEDDTVEYNQKIVWQFNASMSNGLTGDEEFIFPHVGILTMMSITVAENPSMVHMAAKAANSIFKNPDSMFMKTTAKDILFDGLLIDCTVKDFAGSAVCKLLESHAEDLVVVGEDLYRFSFFGHINNTVDSRSLKVIRGTKNAKDVGRLLEWNKESAMKIWAGEPCNSFNGTDASIFHSFLYKDESVVCFFPEVCRSFVTHYESSTDYRGISVNHYTVDIGDQSSIPEEKCFCRTPETCLKKGAMDLMTCLRRPVVATLPHFYLADPSYAESVSGLHPVQENHEIFLDFEPLTGTPLQASKRLQFNMFIFPVEKFQLMKNFPRALLPLIWVAEELELDGDLLNQLKSFFRIINIVKFMKWTLLIVGIGLAVIAGILEYKQNQIGMKSEITPMSTDYTMNDNSGKDRGDSKPWYLNISTLQSTAGPASIDRNEN